METDLEFSKWEKYKQFQFQVDDTGDQKSYKKNKTFGQNVHFCDKSALRTLAGALIQPLFDYVSSSWYSKHQNVLKTKLQKSQNKLIRLLLDLTPMAYTFFVHILRA